MFAILRATIITFTYCYIVIPYFIGVANGKALLCSEVCIQICKFLQQVVVFVLEMKLDNTLADNGGEQRMIALGGLKELNHRAFTLA